MEHQPLVSSSMFARHTFSSGRAASPEIRTAPLTAESIASAKAQGNLELIDGRFCGASTPAMCATPRASSALSPARTRSPRDPAPNAKVVGGPATTSSFSPSPPQSPLLLQRPGLSASIPITQSGLPTKDPFSLPTSRSPHSASPLPASVPSRLSPPKAAIGWTCSTVSSGLTQEPCQTFLDRGHGVRVVSPPRSDNLSLSECHRIEQESCGDVSTTASSVCDSHLGNIDHSSSKAILAKVSEMIRMEIKFSERRMTERLDTERAEMKSVCEKIANDLEAIVNIVEGLSKQNDQHSIATLLEEERHLRDMACVSLHCKLETLASLVKKSCAAANMNEDMNGESISRFVDDMMSLHTSESVDEMPVENQGMTRTRQRINGSSDPMMSPPKGLIACSEQHLDALFEQERQARELACATLRTDLCKEFHGMLEACTETSLNGILEHERQARDVACGTLRADFRNELEVLSMDVKSIAVRIPQYDALQKEHNDLVIMFGLLRTDIQDLASEARRQWRTKSPASSTCNKLANSPPVGDRLFRHDLQS